MSQTNVSIQKKTFFKKVTPNLIFIFYLLYQTTFLGHLVRKSNIVVFSVQISSAEKEREIMKTMTIHLNTAFAESRNSILKETTALITFRI
jgi:hypothetical protein